MITVGEVPWTNRMAMMLFESLFPGRDPFEESPNPRSDLVKIADMMNAAYKAGYMDAMKEAGHA